MISQAPRCTESWDKREWLLAERLIMALRRVPHQITLEIRRDRSGELLLLEVKRREEIRIDIAK